MKLNLARIGCVILFLLAALDPGSTFAQQTLGWIDGTVSDSSGGVLQGVVVKARDASTNLEVTATSKADGSFHIADLPIGDYELSFSKDGFKTSSYPHILVQGNRTATVNARLEPGAVNSTVTVNSTPLLNQTDTTTGYILGALQIDNPQWVAGRLAQRDVFRRGGRADGG